MCGTGYVVDEGKSFRNKGRVLVDVRFGVCKCLVGWRKLC